MLKEAKRLYDLGFAIHWLKPKSKMPVESGWTTGPRKAWEELKASYRPGMNVGVRLGTASLVPDEFDDTPLYLAVIDCDVKSKDKKDFALMHLRLSEIFPDYDNYPMVLSGRGNGSCHFYVRTKTPLVPGRLAQSSHKVKVHMPSVKPTKAEIALLTVEEIQSGMRMRAAWEISAMGEGQQVVLPPSTHPDSGRSYAWGKEGIQSALGIPVIDPPVNVGKQEKSRESIGENGGKDKNDSQPKLFHPVDVDLLNSRLSDSVVGMIQDGDGVEDRSQALFTACLSMLGAGFTDDEILSVLTDRDNYLGEAGYDHAQTTSRVRAAEWVRRFTLVKAKESKSLEAHFAAEIEELPPLDPGETEAQLAEIEDTTDWTQRLEKTQHGAVRNTFKNIYAILTNDVAKNVFMKNTFAHREVYGVAPPWNDKVLGDELRDIDIVNIFNWFVTEWGFEPARDRVVNAISQIASENAFNPAQDYLRGLQWDGTPRIDTWLKTYLNAEGPENYLRAISRKFLCAMVARILQPGVKFDSILILEGLQRAGKSTTARILGGEWFTDAHLNIGDKDSVMTLQGRWVVEIGELSGMKKADVDMLKSYLSRNEDNIRLPYGHRTEVFLRQCVFIGTTNNHQYSKDTTGNTRMWPVVVRDIDMEGLRAARDQLFAEAIYTWQVMGEALYLDDVAVQDEAREIQAQRVLEDPLVEDLENCFHKWRDEGRDTDRIQREALFQTGGPCVEDSPRDQRFTWRLGECMKSLGYTRRKLRDERNMVVWFWVSRNWVEIHNKKGGEK